jgi:hypothetical protein
MATVVNQPGSGPAPRVPPRGGAPIRPASSQPVPGQPSPPRTTPGTLRLLLVTLVLACLGWGAVAAWTVGLHSSAADDVVSRSEPLSLDAQQIYQSLSDADVTVATALLAGPREPLAARQHFDADIARASAGLKAATTASGNSAVSASLATLSAGLPVYTGYVNDATLFSSLGYMAGSSYAQVATEEMHLTLLPAARSIYAQENAQLAAASAQATGLPLVAVTIALALVIGFVLFRAQRWLSRRTHRIVNYGLLTASAAGVVLVLWLATAFSVARMDLVRAFQQGSRPAETLARAGILTQQARGDEILNLISHSGDAVFQQDFAAAQRSLGPGSGTLLTAALAQGGPGARWVAAAAREAPGWYAVNQRLVSLDAADSFSAETQLVIGAGPGTAATQFGQLNRDLSAAMAADQAAFRSSAAGGRDAFTGLEAGIIVGSVVMAAGCAWGITRRLAEYR